MNGLYGFPSLLCSAAAAFQPVVARDFNNIIGVILGFTGLLLERMSPDDPHYQDISQIQKAGDRAALLTRQLLAFSRKQVLQTKVLDLNTVVGGAEELLERLIGEGIELLVVLDPALGLIEADAGQLEQIMMNLAVNARDAMPQGGKLTIETSNVEIDEEYSARHPALLPGSHARLSKSIFPFLSKTLARKVSELLTPTLV